MYVNQQNVRDGLKFLRYFHFEKQKDSCCSYKEFCSSISSVSRNITQVHAKLYFRAGNARS